MKESGGSHHFRKKERLKHKRAFDVLFSQGARFHRPPLSLVYGELHFHDRVPVKCAFSVPKRKFKRAVDRNLLKRRMREAYRQHKHALYETLTQMEKQYGLVFVYSSDKPAEYAEIRDKLVLLLQDLGQHLTN